MVGRAFVVKANYKKYIPLVIIAFMLYSCASALAQLNLKPTPSVLIENVPFHPQEDYQCGPASLAGVLNYWGIDVTPEGIAMDIFSESARGTLNIDMLLYANKKGVHALQYAGSIDNLRTQINAGLPLIVLVDYGFLMYQANHFMVVIGYSDDSVIVNSGRTKQMFIDKDEFLRLWKRTNFWTLLIKK